MQQHAKEVQAYEALEEPVKETEQAAPVPSPQPQPSDVQIQSSQAERERERQHVAQNGPSIEDAKPVDKEPTIDNEMVRKTLEKLGHYHYDHRAEFDDCVTLQPYV